MSADHPRDGSTRVEREILEILERADTPAKPVDELQAVVRRQGASARERARNVPRPELSPEIVKIGGALLLAVGAAMVADFSRLIALVLALASIGVFILLWVPARPSRIGGPQRWRGQDLHDPRQSPGFGFDLGRLRSLWGPKGPRE